MIGVFLEKPFDGPIMEKKLFLFSLINYSILFPKAHVALDRSSGQKLRIIWEPDRNVNSQAPIHPTEQATSLGFGAQKREIQQAHHVILRRRVTALNHRLALPISD